MAKHPFTMEQIYELRSNPNVAKVLSSRIYYTPEFKHYAHNAMLQGKGPTTIFREAGFDTKLLGPKRIERSAARWRDEKWGD